MNKLEITITGILECLEKGMSRQDIAAHYEVSLKEIKAHFQHPKLKGKKAKRNLEFTSILVDDTEEVAQVSNYVAEPTSNNAEEPITNDADEDTNAGNGSTSTGVDNATDNVEAEEPQVGTPWVN